MKSRPKRQVAAKIGNLAEEKSESESEASAGVDEMEDEEEGDDMVLNPISFFCQLGV